MKRVATIGSVTAIIAALGLATSLPATAQFQTALEVSRATADEAKKAQQDIDNVDDQTKDLANQFSADQRQLDASLRYNRSLSNTIEGQNRQIARLQDDITNVASLQQAVEPLMEDMVSAFEKFVDADMPFNLEGTNGRRARAINLRDAVNDPDKSAAQKYRQIIEAYQLEAQFGRTINVFEGAIDIDGVETGGEFLQIGRVELFFKTDDDSVLKAWDNQSKSWGDISKSFLPDLKNATRIAKQQAAPNLFPLPLKRAAAAQ